jgi:hypothetical protein
MFSKKDRRQETGVRSQETGVRRSRAGVVILSSVFCLLASAQMPNGHIDVPKDGPVGLVSVDWSGSRATPRGSAYLVDVHASLALRNSGQKHIRGVTLEVLAQEVTPGGKGAVKVPSLDVAPGDVFSMRIDETLLRPLGAGENGPMVEVRLDGVLFDDLTFYGPDKLNSQREMTVWEMEARRDRKYFNTLLETGGRDGLQKEMLASLTRQADAPRPGVQVVRGRATNADPEHEVQFAFLHVPEAPVEPGFGVARVTANEAFAPRFEVRNLSKRPIRYLEIGWIVKDRSGNEFLAATLPADVNLAPGQGARVFPDAEIRFPDRLVIQSMSGFVSTVEYGDGSYWIPSRVAMDDPQLRNLAAPSPEEQRLSQIYRKKGLDALIQELNKFWELKR